MKIRIKGNSLRLRLTQSEVGALAQGQTVEDATTFSVIRSLKYACTPWHLEIIEAKFEDHQITVFVPESMIQSWAQSDEEGMYGVQNNDPAASLQIAIEKDYACAKPRSGEDESDHFPHPQGGDLKC